MEYPDSKTSETLQSFIPLAYSWHGGQGSPFYSFASTGGRIHSREHGCDLMRECNSNLIETTPFEDEDDEQNLRDFLAEIEHVTNQFPEDEEE